MENVSVAFTKRDFTGPVQIGEYAWEVERLEWRAVGGPWGGRLRVGAGAGQEALPKLWSLVELLRCGITISDYQPAWWGYVSAVEIHSSTPSGRGVLARIELDAMWNRGMVEYYGYNPAQPQGDRYLTTAQQVADSISNYGYKERVWGALSQMTSTQADTFLTTMLARYGQPVQQIKLSEGAQAAGYYGIVELRGWWETLDWRFYSDARGMIGNKSGGTRFGMGTSSFYKWGESFTVGTEAWTVSEVWVKVVKNGIPADNLVVSLCANNARAPGTVLSSGSVAGWAIGTDIAWTKFTLSSPVALTASTQYWVTVGRSGAQDAGNFYFVAADGTSGWAGGVARYYNGSAWVAWTPEGDVVFVLAGTLDAGDQIARILGTSSPGCGQFLDGYRVESTVGVVSIPYRDGSTRGRQELEQHLKTGTSAGARLLAKVEPGW